MGCGSSSTSVQTFRNPEENRNYQSQKAPSRQSSAASYRNQRSPEQRDKKIRRKSSASSVLSKSSSSSRRDSKADGDSRKSSASTKKTYTTQRPYSDVPNDYTPPPVAPKDENENVETKTETPVQTFENEIEGNEIDEKKLEAQRHHEVIQKQTFITGDPDDENREEEQSRSKSGENQIKSEENQIKSEENQIKSEENQNKSREERHEEIAKRKEEIRSSYNHDKIEEDRIKEYGLVALTIPQMDTDEKDVEYTIDDIIKHNNEVMALDWFKYGKKIYSWRMMEPIIKERIEQFKEVGPNRWGPAAGAAGGYPIHVARGYGVSRKELPSVLAVCRVGNCVDIPREEYLARMKQSAEHVLEEDNGSEYFRDYRDQLGRWLSAYPMNKMKNDPPDANSDPNELAFPLPPDILSDPYILRKWTETWTPFDCDIPEEGAWQMLPQVNDDWGDIHELYAKVVQEHHDDGSIEPLNMEIEGDVAWIEIELDLVKNDKTTDSQETIWKQRATRTNLNNPEWMKKRREELAIALKKRYDLREIAYPVENYMSFAEILEKHWKEFQELCEKEFVLPQGNFKKKKQLNAGGISLVNGVAEGDTPALETMDSGLESDSAEPRENKTVEQDKEETSDEIQLTDRPGDKVTE